MRLDLAQRYKRWRHGRGFGIHSPFAYDFITRTLRERLPYYAYDRLDALAASRRLSASDLRRLRLIFRIAVRFNPSTATIIGENSAPLQRIALKAVRRDINISAAHPGSDLYIINEECSGLTASPGDKAVYIFPNTKLSGQETCEKFWASITHGMRFDNSRGFTVIVVSPTLPHQQFDVRF